MRRVSLLCLGLMPLLGAGCLDLGHPHTLPPTTTHETYPDAVPFRMVVVTDEYFPIPSASILVVTLGLNLTANGTGGAAVWGMVPGDYDIVVSHEGFQTNRTTITAMGNQSEALAIQLDNVPRLHPHIGLSWFHGAGTCSAYWIEPAVHDLECRDDPDPTMTPVVVFELPLDVMEVLVNISWDRSGLAGARDLRFDVRVLDDGNVSPFADGQTVLTVEGETGLSLYIGNGLITSVMRAREPTLEVRAFPSARPQESKFYDQRFEVYGTVAAMLPPGP